MIPDPIERAEAAAEDYAFEHSDPVTGQMACAQCGRMFPPAELSPMGTNPYALPVCDDCLGDCLMEKDLEIDFSCRVCGKQCDVAPNKPERAICETCCEDHIYDYDPGERQSFCRFCCKPRPNDWSFFDD